MPIEITLRHMKALEDIQDYARDKAEKLVEEFPGIERFHIVLDIQKHRHIAEVLVQARHHVRAESSESSDSLRVSVDAAMEKVERQLRSLGYVY